VEGLTMGRIVHFVGTMGDVSPALVSRVWNKDTGIVDLHVFTSYPGFPVVRYTSIPYSEVPIPGRLSWHWIPRA
jgi:hypothetical protein